jgi:hypothetical protein
MIICYLLLALFTASEAHAKKAKAAVIEDPDRRPEEQYAAANGMTLERVREEFEATGRIDCPFAYATANVICKANLIATSAHLFQDDESCAPRDDPKSCYFVVGHDAAEQRIPIDGVVASKLRCGGPFETQDDWAVLKLRYPASSVRPYQLPSNRWMPVLPGSRVIAVLSQSSDFTPQGRVSRSIGNCTIKSVQFGDEAAAPWYETNCDAGSGGSGGAILRRVGGGFELVGIVKGQSATSSLIVGVAVTDKFRNAIYDGGCAD